MKIISTFIECLLWVKHFTWAIFLLPHDSRMRWVQLFIFPLSKEKTEVQGGLITWLILYSWDIKVHWFRFIHQTTGLVNLHFEASCLPITDLRKIPVQFKDCRKRIDPVTKYFILMPMKSNHIVSDHLPMKPIFYVLILSSVSLWKPWLF